MYYSQTGQLTIEFNTNSVKLLTYIVSFDDWQFNNLTQNQFIEIAKTESLTKILINYRIDSEQNS